MDARDSTSNRDVSSSGGSGTTTGVGGGEEDPILSVTATLAKDAWLHFNSRRFNECLEVLYQLKQKKEDDPKVLHNIAIAEYSRDGYPDPKKLLEVLNNIEIATLEENNQLMTPPENQMATLEDNNHLITTPEYQLATLEENNQLITTPEYQMETFEENNHSMPAPETQPNKRRKRKSMVWEHFTIETVSAESRRAFCKQCKQGFAYSTGSKVAGTSHLKRHIAKGTCLALLRNQGNQQTPGTPRMNGNGSMSDPPRRHYRSHSSAYISFDSDRCRPEIARMMIIHDYPLHMVEHSGFVTFLKSLEPRFDMVSFNIVQGDCVSSYLREKQNVMKFIEGLPGRVCLTLDVWTSSQSLGYVFITGHFIDGYWKPQRRILNVVMEPNPNSDAALSHAVATCLSDWSLEGKLFSITFNHPVGEPGLQNLRSLLSVKNPLIINGQLILGNCSARTLSNFAKEVLWAGREIIKKVRYSVKYVKTSEFHEQKFLELKEQLQVPSEKDLSLDNQAQWNTTYQMLVAASELKVVFSCLDTSDPDYKEAPSMEDWKRVDIICTYLKPLFDAANFLASRTNPNQKTFFHEVWKMHELYHSITSHGDPFVISLAEIMQEKIDKYLKECILALAIAVVLDPRFRMKLIEFSFVKFYGKEARKYIKIVDDALHELFLEYAALPLPLTPAHAEDGNFENMKTEEISYNELTDFDAYVETTSQNMKSELEQYLEESLLPRFQEMDVLKWWEENKLQYPVLSKMARDILTMQVSTADPDSVFDTEIKELDEYRSSLRPEAVEALVCAKDWLQYRSSTQVSNALVKVEDLRS
ncbi:zinc finger BED domain-containing protein DAYSLEEPER-like isoform X2 [Populus nigra]|uniref:zinc finger BED domain-containing protein DAYSLEEPER-like isoform X2 n=1 Tax=Populus nigra TaxID=3691 RepID=UPI002B275005|nr:zinc finger BED domain-containing protein DAYSLEEPER-like isoform X2 [Populus nigra]